MQISNSMPAGGKAAGLAVTLIRTFGVRALPMVEEQVVACSGTPDLQSRWSEVRNALMTLTQANTHMEAALGLFDEISEVTVSPHLDHAIVQLGLRGSDSGERSADVSLDGCAITYFSERVQRHLAIARRSTDSSVKTTHLDAASYYAAAREEIASTIVQSSEGEGTG